MNITLPADQFLTALKFASHAAATNDIRYYLRAVRIEFDTTGITVIATDGHRIAWLEMDVPCEDVVSMNIKIDCIKELLKIKPSKGADITITDKGFTLGFVTGEWQFEDGNYPQWRRVITHKESPFANDYIGICAKYIGQAMTASSLLTRKFDGVKIKTVSESGVDYGIHIDVMLDGKWTLIRSAKVKVMGMRI